MQLLAAHLPSDWQVNNRAGLYHGRLLSTATALPLSKHSLKPRLNYLLILPFLRTSPGPENSFTHPLSRSLRTRHTKTSYAPFNGLPVLHSAGPTSLVWSNLRPQSYNFPTNQWIQRRLHKCLQHRAHRLLQLRLLRKRLLYKMYRLP